MKKTTLLFFFLLGMSATLFGQKKANPHEASPLKNSTATSELAFPHAYDIFFKNAYAAFPQLPVGILEAVAYTNTRIMHLEPHRMAESCIGMPKAFGVMGLIEDGKGWFRNNLVSISQQSAHSLEDMKQSPEKNILAYAKAFSQQIPPHTNLEQQPSIFLKKLRQMSELPLRENLEADFAMNSFLYSVFYFLNNPDFQKAYDLPNYNIDLEALFGTDNYALLTASSIDLSGEYESAGSSSSRQHSVGSTQSAVSNQTVQQTGNHSSESGAVCSMPNGPEEYPGAVWVMADPSNYSGAITPITVAIHTVQGSYSGAISWFQNPIANVSAHYTIRTFDGQVTQMVCHLRKAWHVSAENPYAVGIEHEGYVEAGYSWYTNAMYESSADVSKFIAGELGINLLQTYDGPGISGLSPLSHTCHKVKGHQQFANNSHVDPGNEWDWIRYYQLLNDLPAPTTYNASSGTVYDSGGASSNYGDEERTTYLIQPSSASTITLTFNSYDVEDGWDYLWIYDGTDPSGVLIGTYSGTSPGTVTAATGAIFMEFRSDCNTNGTGWDATYSTSTTPPTCALPSDLFESGVFAMGATLHWNTVLGATGYEISIKRDVENTWTNFTTSTNSLVLDALTANAVYHWKVRTDCGGGDYSAYVGTVFNTPPVGSSQIGAESYTVTACEGTFMDAGGSVTDYRNFEDWTFTIAPPTASSITVDFSSFDIEFDWDFLSIYDGLDTAAPLIGTYTGTSSPGTVTSSSGAITFHFTSDTWTIAPGWEASWTCNSFCVPDATISPISDWQTGDFTATFTDLDCGVGLAHAFYNVADYDGTEWRSNGNTGFFNDQFDSAIHADWTQATGTWSIDNQTIYQSDEAQSNTNVYANLTQNDNHIYLYEWDAKIDGSGSNRRAGFHFFCDDASLSNRGNSYFVWFRVDDNKLQFYKVTNNVFSLEKDVDLSVSDGTWDNYKVIYDPGSGKMDVFRNNSFLDTWTDPNPITSGNAISLRSGNCEFWTDNVRAYQARSNAETITVGTASADAVRYQSPSPSTNAGKIHSLVINNTNAWSSTNEHSFKVDWTAPSNVSVNDGTGSDINITSSSSQIQANWTTATDPHSNVTAYWYAIGTSTGSTNVVNWTNNGSSTSMTHSGLSLTNGQTYYVSVKSVNGAGLESPVATSNGQTAAFTNVQVTVFLEGPYNVNTGSMITYLRDNSQLPTEQPFNRTPWNYNGSEAFASAVAIPNDAVDWLLIGLYDATDNYLLVEETAAMLLADGSIVNTDGASGVNFTSPAGTYYLVVRSRNHLAVMSQTAVSIPNAGSPYDFTQASSVLGTSQLKEVNSGIYALNAGDFTSDGIVSVLDFNQYVAEASLINQYVDTDVNMDNTVSTADFNYYLPNSSLIGVGQVRY